MFVFIANVSKFALISFAAAYDPSPNTRPPAPPGPISPPRQGGPPSQSYAPGPPMPIQNQAPPAPRPAPARVEPAKPKYRTSASSRGRASLKLCLAAGDRSHIPESDRPIYEILTNQLQVVRQNTPVSHARKSSRDHKAEIGRVVAATEEDG